MTLTEGACQYFSLKNIDQFIFDRGTLDLVCKVFEFLGEVYTSSISGVAGHRVHSVKANSAYHITELVWDLLEQLVAHRAPALSLFHHFLLSLEGSHENCIGDLLHLKQENDRDWRAAAEVAPHAATKMKVLAAHYFGSSLVPIKLPRVSPAPILFLIDSYLFQTLCSCFDKFT